MKNKAVHRTPDLNPSVVEKILARHAGELSDPVVGHARMRVHLLFQALYLNIRATIARMLRTGQQLPFTT